ncbi:MAG: TonB-dependent receptor [Bacteroidota bacterium]
MTSTKTIGTLVFYVATSVFAFGQEGLLSQKVTIRFENSTVAEALEQLMKQTNTTINYRPSELPKQRRISRDFQQVRMSKVINEVWGDAFITLQVSGNAILVKPMSGKSGKGTIRGRVLDENGNSVPFASVFLQNTGYGTDTDGNGNFSFAVPPGEYTLVVSILGYRDGGEKITIEENSRLNLSITITSFEEELKEVVVEGKSQGQVIREDPIKVNVIDAKAFQIQSVGAAEMLRTAPGVLVRRTGGLGSSANVNLNGLQGNAVRIYIDGFPVEYLGGGYNLNNLPGGVIDRLEVYKGVVPADKSIDALGGAVNIVSKRLYNDKLELSYQVGSYNTHRASFLASKQISDHFAITLEGYYNYSDNDFLMGNVRNIVIDSIPDRFTGEPIPSARVDTLDTVRRFHDAHRSSFLQVGLHWNDLSWADKLSFSSNFSNRFDEVQTLNIAQGFALFGRTGETTAFNQSLTYAKTFFDKRLELKYRGVISNSVQSVRNNNLDRFNWNRELIQRNVSDSLNTDTEGLNHAHRLGFIYTINNRHSLSINNFYARTRFFRKDNINPFVEVDGELINRNELPSFFTKNIASIEWRSDWFNKRLTSVVFGKHYFYRAETAFPFSEGVPSVEIEDQTTGYGGALKYVPIDNFFIRGSYEYAVRIPTETEVYGDFVNIVSNFELRPERSNNINLGITYEKELGKLFRINTSLDGFIRDTKDLIWLTPFGAFQRFTNNREVRSLGMEWSVKITKDPYSNIEFNLTNQERTYQAFNGDGLRFEDPSFIGSRFPNTPFFFHNLQLNFGIKSLKSTLPNIALYGSWFHVQKFSITDETSNGEIPPSSLVPTQNEFNLGVGYFSPNNKLSLSFQVNNLTNDLELFDNWRVPKPNRNFQIKVNYQIF